MFKKFHSSTTNNMISTDKLLIQVVYIYIYISQQSITIINRIKLLIEHFVALFSSNNCNYVIGYVWQPRLLATLDSFCHWSLRPSFFHWLGKTVSAIGYLRQHLSLVLAYVTADAILLKIVVWCKRSITLTFWILVILNCLNLQSL